MKRPLILLVAALLFGTLSCARPAATSPAEQPDDIVVTPGGPAYRANVHEQGVPDRWPSIQTTVVVVGNGSDNASVRYRDSIETKAGQTRNNIVDITLLLPTSTPGGPAFSSPMTVIVRPVSPPQGFIVVEAENWYGADPARRSQLLAKIDISSQVKPGQYDLGLDVIINGRDYGRLPCTIKVIK